MFNRILIFFRNGTESKNLINYASVLSEKYGVIVDGIYVKDSRRYEMIPGAYGNGIENISQILIEQWENIDKDFIEKIKQQFKNSNLIEKEGNTVEEVNNAMKSYDLLLVAKDSQIDDDMKSLLRTHIKPIILIDNENSKNGIEKILFANDKEGNSNTSLFSFLNIFSGVNKVESISVNCEIEDKVKSYMDLAKIEYIENNSMGKRGEEIEKLSEEFDIMIMGNLRHSFIVERLGKKLGLRLLEGIKIPIFIG